LRKLSEHDLKKIKELATSPESAVSVRLDNVQYYVHPRTYGIGREAHMVVGTAATAIKMKGFNPLALDILDKQHCIAENK
jgi:N-acetylglutamate synthase-like GNAT family acetyltransferase